MMHVWGVTVIGKHAGKGESQGEKEKDRDRFRSLGYKFKSCDDDGALKCCQWGVCAFLHEWQSENSWKTNRIKCPV